MANEISTDERTKSETEKGIMPMLAQETDSHPVAEEVETDSLLAMNRWRRMGIILVLNTVTMIAAFDATSICVILPSVAKQLNASFSISLGMGSAVLLASAISQPIFAELAQVIGRRPAYLASLVFFMTGSIVSGTAKNSVALLVGRAIQGIGSGGPQALSGLVMADLYSARKRSGSMAYQQASWALGTVTGPLVGGAIVQGKDSAWRWIFRASLPFLALSFIGAWALMGYDQHQRNIRDIKNIDWIGILLYIISAVCLVVPLSWGGSRFPWKSPAVFVPFIVSFFAFIALGLYERKAKRPMFRQGLFRNRSTICHLAMSALQGLLMWMVLYYLAIYIMGVKSQTPLMTGVWALPATITVAPMAAAVGVVTKKTGRYQWFLIGGWCLLVTMFGILTILDEHSSTGAILVLALFMGIAMGLVFPVMTIGVQATCDEQDAGHAISMISVLRTMGQCLGIAVGMSIFSTQLAKELKKVGLGDVPVNNAMQLMRASIETGLGHNIMAKTVSASLKKLWMVGSIMAGVGLVLCLFVRCPRIPKDDDSNSQGKGTTREGEEGNNLGPEKDSRDAFAGQVWEWLKPCLRPEPES
ncbi:multidrug transporter [Fusarium longipes]|uniref:Multidrug transporter n=1 Tax=Fusarium longipes TaxID=694270 RepID=A0A395RTL3_9HYPO|nr:multidrug transporter [Fusarium longipes]